MAMPASPVQYSDNKSTAQDDSISISKRVKKMIKVIT